MSLRTQILNLVATPDRAWLTVLGGILLLCREFLAPGRVVPGVLGGIGVVLGISALSEYRISPQGLSVLMLSIALFALEWRWRPWFLPAFLAAGIGTAGARLLIPPPWRISGGVALATIPTFLFVGYLLNIAIRARRNKLSVRHSSFR